MTTHRAATLSLLLAASFLGATSTLDAQEMEHEAEEEGHEVAGRHRLTLGLGHTHVSQGVIDGNREWLIAASWALNYDYWLSERWAIGVQSDLITEQFPVAHGGEGVIEREFPLSVIPSVLYKPKEWLTVIGGAGAEIAAEETLFVTRLGVEAGHHVTADWEVGVALLWDNKWDYYDSWGLDFSVSRFLGRGR